MALISKEVGLQKASLYHLFPAGKEQMAKAALANVQETIAQHLITPLREPGTPLAKVEAMVAAVRDFYGDGRFSCVFETLSLGSTENPFNKTIAATMLDWQSAMREVAMEAAASSTEANRRAERVLVLIEGALVVARVHGDPKAFARALEDIPETLLHA